MKNVKSAFRGEARVIAEHLEEQIAKNKISPDKSLKQCGEDIATSANTILVKVGKIKANLLRSYPKFPKFHLLKP